jgi:2-haloacid dehalogenase
MRRVQVFDVNETLLDLAAMDPHFQRIVGDAGVRVAWFSQMISSALVATVTGAHHPFGAHAMAALLVARPGKVLDPLVERPGIVGADLAEVAEAILAVDLG